MNENLFRPQFDTLKLSDKLWLMQTLATRYNLTFKELYAFSRWGQSCTTGLFEKGGREFVFVPGDTVINDERYEYLESGYSNVNF